MKSINQLHFEANKLYKKLELGNFFNLYHDLLYDLVDQFNYLENNCEIDYKIATELLNKCKAIIKAQNILIKSEIN